MGLLIPTPFAGYFVQAPTRNNANYPEQHKRQVPEQKGLVPFTQSHNDSAVDVHDYQGDSKKTHQCAEKRENNAQDFSRG